MTATKCVKNPYVRCEPATLAASEGENATERGQTIFNPYRRQTGENNNQTHFQQQRINHQTTKPPQNANIMTQSQWRKSSIRSCKEKATLFRGPRTLTKAPNGLPPCKVCKVKEYNDQVAKEAAEATRAGAAPEAIQIIQKKMRSLPHRAHVKHCPGNKSNKQPAIQQSTMKQFLHHMGERSTLVPLNDGSKNFGRTGESMQGTPGLQILKFPHTTGMGNNNFLAPGGGTNSTNNGTSTTITGADTVTNSTASGLVQVGIVVDDIIREQWKCTPLATELRQELEKKLGDQAYLERFKSCRAPLAIAVLVEYIDSKFQYKRQKYQNLPDSPIFIEKYDQYRRFFAPGAIAFTFPQERRDQMPLAQYHAIEGSTYMHVDWTMSHPEIKLLCVEPGCGGELVRDRFAYQKNKTLVPIIQQSHDCIWVNVMKYLCDKCTQRCAANDGRLLASLPYEVARCYPVKPKYAGASSDKDKTFFQLSVQLSEDLEDNILTYANAGVFSRKIWKRVLREYERRLLDYFSIARAAGGVASPYVSLFEFSGRFYAPSPEQLYDMFHSAERSNLTTTEVSDYDRHRREIIGIGCDGLTAIDWTFNVCNNYSLKEKGAKACFTMNNDAGQVAAAFLVPSTKVGQVAHGVYQVSQRKNFKPKVIATDLWPAKQEFWLSIFGNITGMLGIFHFIKRITDTLRISHSHFFRALYDLKDCIYQYDSVDYGNLLEVLKKGIMSHSAKPMNHEEIEDLQKTTKWNQRYSRFLRKNLYPASTIEHRLKCWVDKYKTCKDPITERLLFEGTVKAVENQIQHTNHIQWPQDIDMYVRIPPGPRATHGLSSFRSRNPEPLLESFHAQFANFGNNRMSDHIGDDIHLRGIAMRNLKIQHDIDVREGLIDIGPLPAHVADVPLLQDHHLGFYINNLAKAAGCMVGGLPYKHLHFLAEDTGEEFLSDYFHSQMKRNGNNLTMPSPANDRCGCCAMHERVQTGGAVHEPALLSPTVVIETASKPPQTLVLPMPGQEEKSKFCCGKYEQYHRHKIQKGRYPPGRVPHDKSCPGKIQNREKQGRENENDLQGIDKMPDNANEHPNDRQEGVWI